MRSLICAILLLSLHPFLYATTFVFKTGKKIEGVVLFEDDSVIRIRDVDGILMSLNKKSLELDLMRTINVRKQVEIVVPPPKTVASDRSITKAPVITNRILHRAEARPATLEQLKERARKAKADYERLQNECRSAGTPSSGRGVLRTTEYMVNGKRVKVTGYWADPKDIERAKNICARAVEAETEWHSAQHQLGN